MCNLILQQLRYSIGRFKSLKLYNSALVRVLELGIVILRLGGANSAGERIACQESRKRQFDATGMPLLGTGGDVGVMQLCNPAANCNQRWNWSANVDQGLALIRTKETEARTYLNGHRINGRYPNDLDLNDENVLLRETVQRYNGGTYWSWNTALNQWQAAPPNGYVDLVLACR